MKAVKDIVGEKTEFGPGKTALYYFNKSLFADPFLERLQSLDKSSKHPLTNYLYNFWNLEEFENDSKYDRAFNDILDLWNKLDQDVPKYCKKERQLQNTWIDPIFKILGWTYELEESSQKNGITNYPDYTLFANEADWKKSKNSSSNLKFKTALAVADAKDWGVSLDGRGGTNQNPSFQIINYLKQTDKEWGILTDGKYWRIYSLRSESKSASYYEIDLEKILATQDYSRFKYFYNFFRVEAFVKEARLNDRTFLDVVFEDGKFYSQRVENNLQERVYKVVDTICQGFLQSYKEPTEDDLKEVYEYSMYYLFKLMFVLNCESKGLLEVNKQDDYYEFSLRKMCIDIKEQFEAKKTWSGQPKTYNDINDLFVLLNAGDSKIGVHGFGNEPFEMGSEEFYSKHKISDEFLNKALLDLSCDFDEEDNLQFIDYKILSPDHIGSLFEGLLEYSIKKKSGKYLLLNEQGARGETAAFYTPENLVNFVVEKTLEKHVVNKSPEDIFKLKIVDPAMGSGHFLLGVVRYLEEILIEAQSKKANAKGAVDFDKIRKEIIKSCIFGVDINPLAVQLAKFSIWIFSSQKGDCLEPLNDQFKSGNSLVDFSWEEEFFKPKEINRFDIVIGNPPYISFYSRFSKIDQYEEDFKFYLKNYELFSGNRINTVMLFIEKTLKQLVGKKQSTSFVIDQNFFEAVFQPLRRYLADNYSVSLTERLDEFTGVNSSQICIFISEKNEEKINVINVKNEIVGQIDYDGFISKTVELNECTNDEICSKMESVLDRSFSNDFDVVYGAQVSGKEVTYPIFISDKPKKNGDYIPLLKFDSKSFHAFKEVSTEGYLLFDPEKAREISKEYKKINVALRERSLWKRPKVLMRQSSRINCATFTNKELVGLYSTFIITSNTDSSSELKALLCYLNSSLASYYYIRKGINRTGVGKQPQIRSGDIKVSFIPSFSKEDTSILARLAEEVQRGTKSLKDVDEFFFKMFKVNKKESETIYSFLNSYDRGVERESA